MDYIINFCLRCRCANRRSKKIRNGLELSVEKLLDDERESARQDSTPKSVRKKKQILSLLLIRIKIVFTHLKLAEQRALRLQLTH